VLDSCMTAGMTSPGVVYVDETVDEYRNLRLPKNWTIHHEPVWGSLQASMQWAFQRFPDATQYGWLADDNHPRTPGWDKQLEAAAGDWNLAYANDGWNSLSGNGEELFRNGHDLSSGLCWGGKLVRTVGWWALPGVRQAGIDTAWTEIVRPLNLHRYLPDVTVEHWNWRSGKRPFDQGDDWVRDGVDYISADIATRNQWVASEDYQATLERVREGIGVHANTEPS
jgi:hypothetical protein